MMMRRLMVMILCLMVLSAAGCSLSVKGHDYETLCKEVSLRHEELLSGKKLEYLEDETSENVVVAGTRVFSDGDYKYYENNAGLIVWIERADLKSSFEYAESMEDCTKEATDWFSKVYQDLRLERSTLEVRREPFDGGTNLVTIIEVLNGAQTGNQASLAFGKNKILFAAAFLYADKKDDQKSKQVLSKTEAFEYAKAAVLQDARDKYGYKGDLPEDLYDTCKGTLRVFNGQEFWEFENVCVWIYHPEWAEREDGTYPQYYMVRIDAYTGECLLLGRSQ